MLLPTDDVTYDSNVVLDTRYVLCNYEEAAFYGVVANFFGVDRGRLMRIYVVIMDDFLLYANVITVLPWDTNALR